MNVVIALLSYSGQPHSQVKNEIFQAAQAMMARGWVATMSERVGACMIPHVRNAAVSEFLHNPDATDLIFVDDDNWCNAEGLLRLVDADVDIVAAPCRSRCEPLTWPIRWMQQTIQRSLNGLIEVETVGTGIMRIRRAVLEKMMAADPDGWYTDATSKAGRSWPLFDYGVEAHAWWGEDIRFCRKARAQGFKVWIDPEITTHHIGRHDFSGSVGSWLKAMPAEIQVATHVKNAMHGEEQQVQPAPEENLTERIAVCVPTRGRPGLWQESLKITLSSAATSSPVAVVGLDVDDDISRAASRPAAAMVSIRGDRLIISVEDREDSLGAKYNRCATAARDADIYLVATDDVTIMTPGWDRLVIQECRQFKDGIGIVFLRNMLGGIAVTHKLVELRGYLCVPDFPFWWHDTELMEIGKMIGRLREAPVDTKAMLPFKGNSRGVRDVAFWAKYFDATRPERVAMAERIIDQLDETLPRKAELRLNIPSLCEEFARSNAPLCDPRNAQEKEEFFSFDAPEDDRYQRIKRTAEKKLARMYGNLEAAE